MPKEKHKYLLVVLSSMDDYTEEDLIAVVAIVAAIEYYDRELN